MCGSTDPGKAKLPVSPSKGQERPDTHVQLTASVLPLLCSGREVTHPLLREQVKTWSGKAKLGILQRAVPFHFICPGGTYGTNSLTSSLWPKSPRRWGRVRRVTTAPTLSSDHGCQLGASSHGAQPWTRSPPSCPLRARDLYLRHAKEPRLSQQMTHRCY